MGSGGEVSQPFWTTVVKPGISATPSVRSHGDPCGLAIVFFSSSSSFSTQSWRSGQDINLPGGRPRHAGHPHIDLVLCVGCSGPRVTPIASLDARSQNLMSQGPAESLCLLHPMGRQADQMLPQPARSAALPLTWHGCPGHCRDEQNPPGTLNRWCHV